MKYSLICCPFIGLTFFSFCTWIITENELKQISNYSDYLLLIAFFLLIISVLVKKQSVIESILWTYESRKYLLIIFAAVCLIFIIPYLSSVNQLTSYTTGIDQIHYAIISKDISLKNNPELIIQNPFVHKNHYAHSLKNIYSPYVAPVIPVLFFPLEIYEVQNILIHFFILLDAILLWILLIACFNYRKEIACIIACLFVFNFNIIWLVNVYHFGNIISMGFFIILFLTLYIGYGSFKKLKDIIFYIPVFTALIFSLIITYINYLPFFFAVSILFLLFSFVLSIKSKNDITLQFLTSKFDIIRFYFLKFQREIFPSFLLLLSSFVIAIIIQPDSTISKITTFYGLNIAGIPMPFPTPSSIFGVVLWSDKLLFFHIVASIIVLWIIYCSIKKFSLKKSQLFSFMLAIITVFIFSYLFLLYQTIYINSVISYKLQKLVGFFLPLLLPVACYYFADYKLNLLNIRKFLSDFKKLELVQKIVSIIVILIVMSIFFVGIYFSQTPGKALEQSTIELSDYFEKHEIKSLNIWDPSYWDMWIIYFLFDKVPLYLSQDTYYNKQNEMLGDVNLHRLDDIVNYSQIIKINNMYGIIPSNILNEVKLGEGWYTLEGSNFNHWRWGGNKGLDPEIFINLSYEKNVKITVDYFLINPEGKFFDIMLNDKKIKECNSSGYCIIESIDIPRGNNTMKFHPEFDFILPMNDPRTLSIAMEKINIIKNE
ncbi:hypothetical protein DLD82_01500 [Methanospirillum stamsii]|uniref:Uncharacterized protein n=1 Tax=Methanospirillum stamsii TaxID=1277351 RepID=A0A2V2NKQ7_9EURY|nr:hypothetical protein DLD82_01500 [Methanospirillum stamsii]